MTYIKLPGYKTPVKSNDPIIPGGHFSWGEATKNGSRIPADFEVCKRIISLATNLEDVRKFLGNQPMIVTSWYRPPHINRSVGGASNSRHLYGDAVDFKINGLCSLWVFDKLDSFWGNRGGLGRHRAFTHIDLRGWGARWNY